jgi:hypothetical protein
LPLIIIPFFSSIQWREREGDESMGAMKGGGEEIEKEVEGKGKIGREERRDIRSTIVFCKSIDPLGAIVGHARSHYDTHPVQHS